MSLCIAVVAACPLPYPRGTPIRILRMAEALARRGHDVHIATYHLGQGEVSEDITLHRTARLPTYRRVAPGPSYQKLLVLDPLLTLKLRRVLRRFRPDVIHAHHYEGLLVALAARWPGKIPVVYDAHTMLASELSYYGMGLSARVKVAIGRRLDKWLPPRADHVISVTEAIRQSLIADSGMSPRSVTTVSNGVEYEHFAACVAAPAEAGQAKRLIFTGNLAAYQGIEVMLRAFGQVAQVRPDVRLCLAVDGDFEPYAPLAKKLGIMDRIELMPAPRFADLPRVLAGADIALNPRIECDGLPVKLLNYMAAAKPVVSFASSAPGVVHGQTGWLVDRPEAAAFAEGILRLLDDESRAAGLGRAARGHIESHHRWEIAAERIETVYRSLLDRPA